jgi:uncharacterized membrane protein YbhN (UPF0104 family)
MLSRLIEKLLALEPPLREWWLNQRLARPLRWFIFVVLALGLWWELQQRNDLDLLWAEFMHHLYGANWVLLIAVVVLMPLNWLAETEKWLQFVRRYEEISRWRGMMAVFTGASFSLFTPNRVGEYGGRLLHIRPENHWKAVVANLVGNFCQYMVLLGTGIAGAAYLLRRFSLIEPMWSALLLTGATLALAVMSWVYFHIETVITQFKRLTLLEPLHPLLRRLNFGVFRHFNRRELFDILRWATVRYFIYATQYYLLLLFFGIQVGILEGFAGIAGLFLLQTSIPLPPLAGLAARGNMAVLLWEQFGANQLSALAATFTLWVINLIIPALIGTFSVLYVNISKTKVYDDDETPVAREPT